ncbi:hypothetical protein ACFQ88_10675 [Paenibacillus sp. NPDC056579]|uniref:hypothetical protein n=1 Tax=unclassified Paenibacillus TaxID=185978 RepID=UPI001EF873E4|nr:hypothetical protein [Paenibacillus sp. H1-7]ULL14708.1 hypothetical protein DVH26_09740 [Paenibacillus sp. H1-7]
MRTSILWLSALLLWTSLLVAHPLSSAAVTDNPPIPAQALLPASTDSAVITPSFMDAVNQWMKRISNEQGYEAWKQATWTSYPLGPGTHGWIILLKSGGAEVGYMVLYADDPGNPNKYRLAEYGRGNTPLFSLNTLYRSLVQLELIDTSYQAERWYSGPFYAVWKVTSGTSQYIIDAKTGELLPVLSDKLPEADSLSVSSAPSVQPEHSILSTVQIEPFDPYDRLPWVSGKPIVFSSLEELETALTKERKLTFVTELYDRKVTVPLAVTGLQRWSDDSVFLLLDQEGTRAIPYDTVMKLGSVFP